MTIGGCRRTNRRKMSEETKPKSYPWKTVGYFDSFEEADKKRNALLGGKGVAKSEYAMQAKVKRCRDGGEQFMVKARLDPTKNPPKEKKQTKKQKKK